VRDKSETKACLSLALKEPMALKANPSLAPSMPEKWKAWVHPVDMANRALPEHRLNRLARKNRAKHANLAVELADVRAPAIHNPFMTFLFRRQLA
jgi:hypothetical protein